MRTLPGDIDKLFLRGTVHECPQAGRKEKEMHFLMLLLMAMSLAIAGSASAKEALSLQQMDAVTASGRGLTIDQSPVPIGGEGAFVGMTAAVMAGNLYGTPGGVQSPHLPCLKGCGSGKVTLPAGTKPAVVVNRNGGAIQTPKGGKKK